MLKNHEKEKSTNHNYLAKVIGCLLLIAQIWVLFRINIISEIIHPYMPLWDFDAYYQLARSIVQAVNPYQVATMQTLGPPLVIAPFIFFSFLSLPLARSIYLVLSLCASYLSCLILAHKIRPQHSIVNSLLLHLVLLLSFPARFTFITGQPHFFSLILIELCIWSDNVYTKGVSAALLTVIKTFFAFPVLAFIRSNTSVVLTFAITLGIIVAALLPVIKPNYYQYFITERLQQTVVSSNAAPDLDYYNQSLKATLQRAGLPNAYQGVIVVCVIVAATYVLFSGDVMSAFVLSIVLSPVFWQHYMVLLFPIFMLILPTVIGLSRLRWIWLLSFWLYFVEFPWLHQQPETIWFRLLASHYFISALLLLLLTVLIHHQQNLIYPPRSRRRLRLGDR